MSIYAYGLTFAIYVGCLVGLVWVLVWHGSFIYRVWPNIRTTDRLEGLGIVVYGLVVFGLTSFQLYALLTR
jgi:hypothetical protein